MKTNVPRLIRCLEGDLDVKKVSDRVLARLRRHGMFRAEHPSRAEQEAEDEFQRRDQERRRSRSSPSPAMGT